MRNIVLISWLILFSAAAGGAVWAAERAKIMSCTVSLPRDHASLAPTEEYPLAAGRVVAVDSKAGKVTVAAGPIARFYLEPTTRIFHVEDPTLLAGLTPGDKIRFDLARAGKGFVITRIENSN
jgi:Cu(I)/Ag(I) efflux system periplasmic protein CusF